MTVPEQHASIEEIEISSMDKEFRIGINQLVSQKRLPLAAFSDPLTKVVAYYLKGEGHLNLRQEMLRQIFLSVVAVSGAGLYAVPADAYAKSVQSELAGRINYIISTCVPALVVLYNSTELFLGMRAAENIPLSLKDYLISPCTPRQKIVENIIITLGSAISAFPLAAVSFIYPIPGLPKEIIILQSVIVEFDNTILHFLPIKLALQNALYRLPILPFEFIFKKIADCCLSAEQRQKNQLQKQIDQYYQVIKQRFISHLEQSKNLLAIYGFKFEGKCLNYTNRAGNKIRELCEQGLPPLVLLQELLDLIHAMSPEGFINPPSRVNRLLRKFVYIPGALWVMSSCAGFLIAPVDELTELTGSKVMGAGFSAPSVYFLGVLLAFFGGNSLQNAYDYFTLWQDDAVKISQELKCYPKTSILLIIISLYLSIFSYAAGAELINDNFKGDLAFLRPEFLAFAKTGLAFLGFTAMLDFLCSILKKFSQYGKNEEAEIVVKLSEAFNQLGNSIQLMKPDKLIASLSHLEADRLKSILNIRGNTDKNELIYILDNLRKVLEDQLDLVGYQEPKNDNASQSSYIPPDFLSSRLSDLSLASQQTIRQGGQQGARATTSLFSPCSRRYPYSCTSDDESSPSVSRRVTRTNSIDTTTETDSFHGSSDNDAELESELEAVDKLIQTLNVVTISGDNYDISENSQLISPPLFSRRSLIGGNNNNNRYGSINSSSSSTHPVHGETSFSHVSL
jgi:hypothetical protein